MSSLFTSEITVENLPLPVDGSGVTQPVSGSISVTNFPATQPVSGSVSVSNFPATQPVSGTVSVSGSVAVTGPLTDAQLRATPISVTSAPVTSNSATISQVVLSSNTNATLLAANGNRKKVVLFAPKSTLYVKFGVTASSTSFTYIVMAANTTLDLDTWIGQIDVLSTVNQTVTVTEMV